MPNESSTSKHKKITLDKRIILEFIDQYYDEILLRAKRLAPSSMEGEELLHDTYIHLSNRPSFNLFNGTNNDYMAFVVNAMKTVRHHKWVDRQYVFDEGYTIKISPDNHNKMEYNSIKTYFNAKEHSDVMIDNQKQQHEFDQKIHDLDQVAEKVLKIKEQQLLEWYRDGLSWEEIQDAYRVRYQTKPPTLFALTAQMKRIKHRLRKQMGR